MSELRSMLRDGTLRLDAAMGTALLARGLRGRAPAWNLAQPEAVLDVHRAHVAAGADLVLTNTFVGATPREALAAIELARACGARFVGGSLWAGLPELEAQIAQLAFTDCIWLESAISADQALAAVRRACRTTELPVVVTCAMRAAPLSALRDAGAAAAGYNCSPWPDDPGGADILKPDSAHLQPEAWARAIAPARLRGGCCGTDAGYLSALRATER